MIEDEGTVGVVGTMRLIISIFSAEEFFFSLFFRFMDDDEHWNFLCFRLEFSLF